MQFPANSAPSQRLGRALTAAASLAAAVALVSCSSGSGTGTASSPARSSSPSGSGATAPVPRRAAGMVTATVAPFRLPATLSRAVAYPAGDRLLVATGLHDGDRSTGTVLAIDPQASTVSVAGRLPTAVHDAAGAALAGTPTVFGGGAATEVGTIQQVDATGRTARSVGTLPVPTSDAVAVAVQKGVVLAGGYDGARTLAQVLLLSAPGSVRTLSPLPVPVRYPAIAAIGTGNDQRILLFGGESGGVATDAVQEIDPGSGAVRVVGHLPARRTQAMAVALGGSIFLAGGAAAGTTGAPVFSDVLRYDPNAHSFTPAGTLPYATSDAAVAVIGQTAYLVGGETPTRTDRTITLAPMP